MKVGFSSIKIFDVFKLMKHYNFTMLGTSVWM